DLVEAFGQMLGRAAAELDLTSARAELVFLLTQHGPQRQRRVAELLGTSPQQAAVMVDALVERGLLSRSPDPTDRRAVLVGVTEKGERAGARIEAMRARSAERLLGDLGDDRVTELSELVQHLLDRVRP
ncbi:MAG: MarR family transcriptional regulator, partial [Propionibacterium sp.]|nr:MarR family transcriptional regulator [Propionibacterium sp.]